MHLGDGSPLHSRLGVKLCSAASTLPSRTFEEFG